MTEKKQRFTIEPTTINDCIVDNTTGEQLDTFDYTERLCEVLNALHEENQRLQKERNHFERKKTEYLTEWNTCRIQNTELKKDNHELKEAMKRMMIEMMGGKMND